MPSLKSYFKAQGKSFESYSQWLGEATPEELLADGVRPGMLVDLYGIGGENISKYRSKAENYLCNNGFTLKSIGHRSSNYSLDKNKNILISLGGEFAVSMMALSDKPCTNDLELTKDISQVILGLLSFVQQEEISARLLPSPASDYNYEVRNYKFDQDGFRIFSNSRL